MKDTAKILAAGMGTALFAAGAVQGAALAAPVAAADASLGDVPAATADAAVPNESGVVGAAAAKAPNAVKANQVVGTFSFTQEEASSNEWIYRHIGEGAKYLCGSEVVHTADAPAAEDWTLAVTGSVENPYEATIGELASSTEVQAVLMGCACAGNPTDGLSVANALVEGISVLTLVGMATPDSDANTIVFTSADGYEIALPLSYIESHYCPLVFNVNGSALVESVGGTNQLWLGSTPASYFARDIVSIRLEVRDEAPVSPSSEEARATYGNPPQHRRNVRRRGRIAPRSKPACACNLPVLAIRVRLRSACVCSFVCA